MYIVHTWRENDPLTTSTREDLSGREESGSANGILFYCKDNPLHPLSINTLYMCGYKDLYKGNVCSVYTLYKHMTRNARWRSRHPRYKAAVHVPNFDTLDPAPELSLLIQLCRHISKGIIFCIHERQLWSGSESVGIRYMNGSFVAGTSASSPGVTIQYFVYFRYKYSISSKKTREESEGGGYADPV